MLFAVTYVIVVALVQGLLCLPRYRFDAVDAAAADFILTTAPTGGLQMIIELKDDPLQSE